MDSPALHEGDAFGWHGHLAEAPHPALDAMVQAIDPRARCVPATPRAGGRLAWDVVVDAAATPAEPPIEVGMVANTNTARFVFQATPIA
jgi:hypothetical protein